MTWVLIPDHFLRAVQHCLKSRKVLTASRRVEWLTTATSPDLLGQFLDHVACMKLFRGFQFFADHNGYLRFAVDLGRQHQKEVVKLVPQPVRNVLQRIGTW